MCAHTDTRHADSLSVCLSVSLLSVPACLLALPTYLSTTVTITTVSLYLGYLCSIICLPGCLSIVGAMSLLHVLFASTSTNISALVYSFSHQIKLYCFLVMEVKNQQSSFELVIAGFGKGL